MVWELYLYTQHGFNSDFLNLITFSKKCLRILFPIPYRIPLSIYCKFPLDFFYSETCVTPYLRPNLSMTMNRLRPSARNLRDRYHSRRSRFSEHQHPSQDLGQMLNKRVCLIMHAIGNYIMLFNLVSWFCYCYKSYYSGKSLTTLQELVNTDKKKPFQFHLFLQTP